MEVIQELLELLKNELFITWEDEITNKRLTRIIKNATASMNNKLGVEINYLEDELAQNLFLQLCVYIYNGVTNDFDNNYYHEINQLRMYYEVNGVDTDDPVDETSVYCCDSEGNRLLDLEGYQLILEKEGE